jgi:hypothetical protein
MAVQCPCFNDVLNIYLSNLLNNLLKVAFVRNTISILKEVIAFLMVLQSGNFFVIFCNY